MEYQILKKITNKIRRFIKKYKILWIILILIWFWYGVSCSVTIGDSSFEYSSNGFRELINIH